MFRNRCVSWSVVTCLMLSLHLGCGTLGGTPSSPSRDDVDSFGWYDGYIYDDVSTDVYYDEYYYDEYYYDEYYYDEYYYDEYYYDEYYYDEWYYEEWEIWYY